MLARIAMLVLVAAHSAHAQPRSVIGQLLPDPNMPVGSVSVRVLAGEPSKPAANVAVTLAIAGGKATQVTTDASGRAQFVGIAAKSRVTVSVVSTAPDLARSTFVMPDAGGARLMLSTAPWKVAGMPSGRELSGTARPDPDVAAGTLQVKLAYDLRDPNPPAGIAVTLVGYAADGKITVVSKPSDPKGIAAFTALDTGGLTAYFAFAILPRAGTVDRLGSEVFVPDAAAGVRVLLSSHPRDSKEPPIELETTAVPKGKVRVEVSGIPDVAAPIEVFDATTGKVLATGRLEVPNTHVVLDVKTVPGQVIYAQTTARGESYRSRPVPVLAERGAMLAMAAVPRLLQKFELNATPEDGVLAVQMRVQLDNNAWLPATPKGGIEVPLPIGFKGLVFRDGDEVYAKPTAKGFVVAGPLPPGGRAVILGFSLPFKNTRADISMDLPVGTIGSRLRVQAEPGVRIVDMPPSTLGSRVGDQLIVDNITIPSGKSMRFAVIAPKPDPKVIALKKTCRDLAPNAKSPLLGTQKADFTGSLLDGKSFKLSSLKGKLVILTFNASWNSLRNDQKTLPAFAKAVGAELVTVLSDSDPVEIEKAFGKLSTRVVLDKPVNADAALGPITGSWGITVVPETYVVDRTGTIRMHVINQRDWSTPSIAACLKASL